MIEHIVLIKWKDDTSQNEIDAILRELANLKNIIPGIASYKVGHNLSDRSQGYGAGITSTFTNQESLATYLPHPEHQKIVAKLKQKAENLLVVDFQAISSDM